MAKFEIIQMRSGEYHYRLIDDNGQEILFSMGFYTKTACENAINHIKTCEVTDANFPKMCLIEGEYFFYFMGIGFIIATSEKYDSESERDAILEKIKTTMDTATIEEVSA